MLTGANNVVSPTARLRSAFAFDHFVEQQGLLLLVLSAYAAALLLTTTGTAPDTWLAIVGGREVSHGLPSADHLTVFAAGAHWVDQQWLAQLFIFGANSAGGLVLVALVSAALAFVGIAGAAAFALWRGAEMRATVWIAAVALVPYVLPAEVPRTQSLTYPLFVAVVWLLARDSLKPSPQVLIALPLLILWANLHGSILVAVAVVALHGVLVLRRQPVVGAALACGSLLSVFASPYATGLPHYYRSTIFNPAFKLLSEWGPTTLKLETLPLFALLIGAAYLYGRAGRLFTGTEAMVLAVSAGAALHAVRFTVWFAMAALMILPAPLTSILHTRTPPPNLNRLCGRIGLAVIAGLIAVVLFRGVPGYPPAAAGAVTAAAGNTSKVYASELYGDWLLTVAPTLRGRVAYDSRIELLPPSVVARIQAAQTTGLGWRDLAGRYEVFVLNADDQTNLIANLARAGYAKRYQRGSLVVMSRPRSS